MVVFRARVHAGAPAGMTRSITITEASAPDFADAFLLYWKPAFIALLIMLALECVAYLRRQKD